jgi:hypothetical protein
VGAFIKISLRGEIHPKRIRPPYSDHALIYENLPELVEVPDRREETPDGAAARKPPFQIMRSAPARAGPQQDEIGRHEREPDIRRPDAEKTDQPMEEPKAESTPVVR